MGTYLAFVNHVDQDGEPTDDATWLQTNVKTSYLYDFEQEAAKGGLVFTYPKNGTRATVEQLRVYKQYVWLLKMLYAASDEEFFEHDAMAEFLAKHHDELSKGTWYWHQG